MFQTQILDVAIGLVFVYLVLSTVVSAFSEFLEVWLKRRPRMLLESVTQLVGSPEAASRIYKHPLISSLARKGSHPSYIPAKTFALAVLDSLGVLGEGGMASVLPDLSKVDGEFGDSLRVLAHDAGGDLEKFKQGIEQWFDNAMDRVTGWYKRQTQWILLIVAVVLTVWANADTLKIAKELWTNPGVRAAFVAQAQQSVAQQGRENSQAKEDSVAPQGQAGAAKDVKPAAVRTGPPLPPSESPAEAEDVVTAEDKLQASVRELRSLALPLGWRDTADPEDRREPAPYVDGLGAVVGSHLLGWLLTAMAVSLGAPFWFDLLNKLVSVRVSGTPPEKKSARA